MDKTQLLILSVLSFVSVMNIVLSSIGIIELIVFLIAKKVRVKGAFHLLFMLIVLIISIAFAVYSVIIRRFAGGV